MISLLPLDVGFDLRFTGIKVKLHEGYSYQYLSFDGKKEVIEGTLETISHGLRKAGYTI